MFVLQFNRHGGRQVQVDDWLRYVIIVYPIHLTQRNKCAARFQLPIFIEPIG